MQTNSHPTCSSQTWTMTTTLTCSSSPTPTTCACTEAQSTRARPPTFRPSSRRRSRRLDWEDSNLLFLPNRRLLLRRRTGLLRPPFLSRLRLLRLRNRDRLPLPLPLLLLPLLPLLPLCFPAFQVTGCWSRMLQTRGSHPSASEAVLRSTTFRMLRTLRTVPDR